MQPNTINLDGSGRFNRYKEHSVFPVLDGFYFPNIEYIHPLKQFNMQFIYDCYYCDKNILLLVVFGSSVTMHCHSWSDIDLYVELADRSKLPYDMSYDLQEEIDLLHDFRSWDTPIGREVASKGIIMFDRRYKYEKEDLV